MRHARQLDEIDTRALAAQMIAELLGDLGPDRRIGGALGEEHRRAGA
jgi:hypothetical protein